MGSQYNIVTANGAVYTNHKVNSIAIIVKEYIVLQVGGGVLVKHHGDAVHLPALVQW